MDDQSSDFRDGAERMAALTDMVIDQIRKLAEHHEEGILTDDEFTGTKAELLTRL